MGERWQVCVLDVGSRNLKVVCGRCAGGAIEVETMGKVRLDLGREVERRGEVGPRKMAELSGALSAWRDEVVALGARRILAIGTSALRRASNRPAVLDLALGLGIPLHVVDGAAEGVYAHLAATGGIGDGLVSELGSGSCQVAWRYGGDIESRSLELGYERVYAEHVAVPEGLARGRRRYRERLSRELGPLPGGGAGRYVALAAKTMAGFVLGCDKNATPDKVVPAELLRGKVRTLTGLDADALGGLPRARKVVPAMLFVEYLLDVTDHDEVTIGDAELAGGVVVASLLGLEAGEPVAAP